MSEQTSNNKWKGLAKKLYSLVKPMRLTPKNVYEELRKIFTIQRDFFAPLLQKNPHGYIKVVYYVYSLLETGNFELGDKIIPNLGFASILTTENENYHENCDTCSGDGVENCSECDGSGSVECNNCDSEGEEECYNCNGEGSESCYTCDGTGEDEEGNECNECGGEGTQSCGLCNRKGKITCSTCDGDKDMSCTECQGNGYFSCDNCNGRGDVETDKIKYEKYEICTYNESIKNSCELNANTLTPIITGDYSFDEFWENVIVLKYNEDEAEALENIKTGDIYCFYYDTNSGLSVRSSDMTVVPYEGEEDFYFDV